MTGYEPVIGLEVHLQLKTRSKIFCGCSTEFGQEPNSNTCPVCLGYPGSLPVLNREAFLLAIRVALALGCQVAERLKFDRKNYFYPDLPKAYQISQYDKPLSYQGSVEIELNGEKKKIHITRAHLEEDAGKLLHEGIKEGSLVDYNRAGIPLLEIVSEPDLRSPDEAYEYLTTVKAILQYIGASDCDMEKGSLRCDANVSIRKMGETRLGTKVEIKNMNSFSAVKKALAYEMERQVEVLSSGGKLTQETRLWDDLKEITLPMRSKEYAHDYRYFPEPDLVPFTVSRKLVEEIRRELPELPNVKRVRFIRDYDLTSYDAGVLTQSRALADYFERCVKTGGNAKAASNWIQTELLGKLNETGQGIADIRVTPEALAGLIGLIAKGTISGKMAKEVFPEMLATGKLPETIVKEKGLAQVSDEGLIRQAAEKVVASNPDCVADYRKGKEKALIFLVGQLMKETRGKAKPELANKLLKEVLEKVK